MKTIKTMLVLMVGALLMSPGLAFAGDEEFDRKINEARKKLDAAARELAELHRSQYSDSDYEKNSDCPDCGKKAMLGILLGDGPGRGGIELVGVTPGGGAEEAGLKTGDLIVRVDTASLAEAHNPMRALTSYMKNIKPGESVEVTYVRKGERTDAVITTQARSSHMMKVITDKVPGLGLDLEGLSALSILGEPGGHKVMQSRSSRSDRFMYVAGDLAQYFDVERGVIMTRINEGSVLKSGDVLLDIGGEEIDDVGDAIAAIKSIEEDTQATIKRSGREQQITLTEADFAGSLHDNVQVIRIEKP